VSVTKVGAL